MSVANPSMLELPAPSMPHSLSGLPCSRFSATTLLSGVAAAAAARFCVVNERCVIGGVVTEPERMPLPLAVALAVPISPPPGNDPFKFVESVHLAVPGQLESGDR